eukprot:CAMPEP_0171981658 /NCGR_PEP_ID=MMETSP0993-20121228/267377_1 /TAXON_ID=483369 /ORGANISM="non described non described, Strain CCMP2098" /LENGTH=54 /DNA_ID=CAMNT_0012634115 /DNA_START=82 /DNA_END=243 /DNA_ORIENTATION=-
MLATPVSPPSSPRSQYFGDRHSARVRAKSCSFNGSAGLPRRPTPRHTSKSKCLS